MADMTPNVLMSAWIRWPRLIAMRFVAAVILAAAAASFAQSYRGLYEWAARHGVAGFWAACWPLMVDSFIAVGEVALFIALVDNWRPRWRRVAWAVTGVGVAISVTGNVGHAPTHDLATRATFAVPPLAAAGALFVGLLILKAVIVATPEPVSMATATAREVAMARSGEHGYAAMLTASGHARDAAKRQREKVAKEQAPKRPKRAAKGRPSPRPTSGQREAAMAALIAQPDMDPADWDAAKFGAEWDGRTGRRWRKMAAAGANGHGQNGTGPA